MKRVSKKKKRVYTAGAIIIFALSLAFTSLMGNAELPFGINSWRDIFELADVDVVTQVPDSDFSVTFLDVGQGDCAVVRSEGKTMLIDGGESENADKILSFLKENSITKLDCVVATHPHSDHIGSLPKVIENIEVGTVIMPEISEENIPTTKVYEDFLLAVHKSGADVMSAWLGDSFTLGDAECKILSPGKDDKELNNMSVVIKLTYGRNSFLFMGDAEKEAESFLMSMEPDISADVIKIGHHGSDTSTGDSFLKAVSPKIAVISAGEDNRYGHPDYKTLEKLRKCGAEIYITKDSGDIVVTSDKINVFVSCQKEGA